jgi:hypothetical protein
MERRRHSSSIQILEAKLTLYTLLLLTLRLNVSMDAWMLYASTMAPRIVLSARCATLHATHTIG